MYQRQENQAMTIDQIGPTVLYILEQVPGLSRLMPRQGREIFGEVLRLIIETNAD